MFTLPTLPPVRSIIALAAVTLLVGIAIWQTVAIHGPGVKVPLIGHVIEPGWKPWGLKQKTRADEAEEDLEEAYALFDAEVDAHQQTKINYTAAQAEALERQRNHIVRVELKRREKANEVNDNLKRELASTRSRYERLRDLQRAERAADGEAGRVRMSQATAYSIGLDDTPPCDTVYSERTPAIQLECDRIAEEQALQLQGWQEWARKIWLGE